MIDPSIRRTIKRKYGTFRRVGFRGVVGKYWNQFLWKMTGPDSVGRKKEDGLSIRFFRGARFQPPEIFNKMGIETFDVALSLKGDVAIDIGAHTGAYAMRLARNFQQVYAFEPNPAVYKVLKRNIKDNKIENVQAEPIALSDKDGTAVMRTSQKFLSAATIAEKHYDWLEWDKKVEVQVESLDSYWKRMAGKIDFVKIDVEGHELAVLKGMTETIKKDHPIMSVEVHQRPTTLTSCNCEVCQWLKQQDLNVELHGKYTPDMEAHWLVCR